MPISRSAPSTETIPTVDGCQRASQMSIAERPSGASKARNLEPAETKRPSSNMP
ncbi:hypothetical protein D3C86_2002460 [compost metagenome]